MKTFLPLIALATLAAVPGAAVAQAPTAASATAGKMLYAAGGKRLASVYRVATDGSPQVILDGRLVTVPASTLTLDNGKVTTSLTKAQLTSR